MERVKLLLTKHYSFSLGRISFTSDDGSQNIFVYQTIINVLELKKGKSTEYIISWKSKGVYNFELIALHGPFLPNVNFFRNKIRIQFNNTPFVIE